MAEDLEPGPIPQITRAPVRKQSQQARKKAQKKKQRKWNDRLSLTDRILTMLGTAALAVATTVGVIHVFFPGPPARLGATITRITIRQGVTGAGFQFDTGMSVPPVIRHITGVEIQVQASLNGYQHHIYSSSIGLLDARTKERLSALTSKVGECSELVPTATQNDFVIECWIGEPLARQQFDVEARIYYTGHAVSTGKLRYFPVTNPQYLAVLDAGPFISVEEIRKTRPS